MSGWSRRAVLVGFSAAAAILMLAATVYACTTIAHIDLDETHASPGAEVSGTGRYFLSSAPITIHFNSLDGDVLWEGAPSNGRIEFSFKVPAGTPAGYYTIVAVQKQNGENTRGTPARATLRVGNPNVRIPQRDGLVTNVPGAYAFQQPNLAKDPSRRGRLAIAYQEGNGLDTCYLSTSRDDGRTWKNIALVGADGRYALGDESYCWNPMVAYGPDGTLYYVFQDGFYFSRGTRQVQIIVSRDGGKTFSEPQVLSGGDAFDYFWPAVAVDQTSGDVHVVWNKLDANMFWIADGFVEVTTSTDNGETFSTPTAISPVTQSNARGTQAAVARDGKLYVAWLDTTTWNIDFQGQPMVLYVSSSEDGKTFSLPVQVAKTPPGAFGRSHVLAPGAEPDSVSISWWSRQSGPAQIMLANSRDGGTTWSAPRPLTTTSETDGPQQLLQWAGVAPNGRMDVAYYNDDDEGSLRHVFWASSTDEGETFSRSKRLTKAPMQANVGPTAPVPPDPSWGEFIGLVSENRRVYVAWTDNRRGNESNGKQDIFFARLRLAR